MELTNCVGDVMMAAACVAYQGAFTSNYRIELTKMWEEKCGDEKIPSTEGFRYFLLILRQFFYCQNVVY